METNRDTTKLGELADECRRCSAMHRKATAEHQKELKRLDKIKLQEHLPTVKRLYTAFSGNDYDPPTGWYRAIIKLIEPSHNPHEDFTVAELNSVAEVLEDLQKEIPYVTWLLDALSKAAESYD